MRKNLIFKQVSAIDNVTKTAMKIVAVEIPDGIVDDSWSLVGECDVCEFVESKSAKKKKTTRKKEATAENKTMVSSEENTRPLCHGDKYISSVPGTARLIRANDEIIIAKRKGNLTLNQNDENSVCIDDATKVKFFSDCRSIGAEDWRIHRTINPVLYTAWSIKIDDTYTEGLDNINRSR